MTNFESGGYSIGLSCSILIADIFLDTDFLTKWAQIQSSLAHSQTVPKPIFHLPSLKQDNGNFFVELSRSDSVLDRGEPIVFQAKTCSKMSPACMKKAVVTRKKASPDVFLFVKQQGGGQNGTACDDAMKVEIHSRDEAISDCDCGVDLEETDDGVVDKSLAFRERLEGTSCWVGSVSNGAVFVLPSTFGNDAKSPAKFVVALPKE